MSDHRFHEILTLEDDDQLRKGVFLWIWYADKIPPHIGCSVEGKYYSLKVNGKDVELQTEKVIGIVRKRKILTVILSLNVSVSEDKVATVFERYSHAQSGISTCLTPVLAMLDLENKRIEQLSTLLKYLESNNILGKVFGLNLTEGYSGIPEYGAEDIQNRLRKLENVQIKTGLPPVR